MLSGFRFSLFIKFLLTFSFFMFQQARQDILLAFHDLVGKLLINQVSFNFIHLFNQFLKFFISLASLLQFLLFFTKRFS